MGYSPLIMPSVNVSGNNVTNNTEKENPVGFSG